ncbi:MAG: hypothetical protein WDZ33_00725, partial [Balneolaceae bacterium]
MIESLEHLIFDPGLSFQERATTVFQFQMRNNPVYQRFAETFGLTVSSVPEMGQIPLLPVSAFREARILSTEKEPRLRFSSSGTTAMKRSIHEVVNPDLYRRSILDGFRLFYPENAVIHAWLPGYSDNPESSLIWMLRILTEKDTTGASRFLVDSDLKQGQPIIDTENTDRPHILFGAAFGLLDLIDSDNIPRLFGGTTIIETGGMKTHRREMSRKVLHDRLAGGFSIPPDRVHSEYGMCELLSQAYSDGTGWFSTPPWMAVSIRRPDNPIKCCKP